MQNVNHAKYINEELTRILLDLDSLIVISGKVEFLKDTRKLISLATEHLDSRIIVSELLQNGDGKIHLEYKLEAFG